MEDRNRELALVAAVQAAVASMNKDNAAFLKKLREEVDAQHARILDNVRIQLEELKRDHDALRAEPRQQWYWTIGIVGASFLLSPVWHYSSTHISRILQNRGE
jgi:hypothetical protein